MPKARRSFKDRQLARDTLRKQVGSLIRPVLEDSDTPRALSVWLLFVNKEDDQIAQLSCNPQSYDLPKDNDLFRRDYMATKLLSKWDGLDVSWDPKAVAVSTALQAEQRCSKTNRRFQALRNIVRPLRPHNIRALHLLMQTQKIVLEILGDCPRYPSFSGWSPGRTTKSKSPALSALEKFRVKPDVTTSAIPLAFSMLRESPLWGQQILQSDGPVSLLTSVSTLDVIEGNFAFVVPKNAKTGRFCCYEPHMNIALQLSIGKTIRRRLKQRVGIDLNDQSTNRRLALEGSRSGLLATIDLSSASDTIATELVRFLLPEKWYSLLDRTRSRHTNYFGSWRRNHKFSSMGNGFTFELESLIFFALCKAVAQSSGVPFHRENSCVFGDDIVVPTSIYKGVVSLLEFSGFAVNTAKSFHTGPFRESCGVDAVSGWVITPPMIRPGQRGLNLSIAFHNRLRDYCRVVFSYIPRGMQEILYAIRAQYPGPVGPSHYGDGHYHVNFDEARPIRAFPTRGWEGYFFKTRKPFSRTRMTDFMDGTGSYDFRRTFGHSAILASTFCVGALDLEPRELMLKDIEASRDLFCTDDIRLINTLVEGGSYTNGTLRVLSRDWESLDIL